MWPTMPSKGICSGSCLCDLSGDCKQKTRREKQSDKGGKQMKEVIVIFATVVLGIAIAGFVMNLEETAQSVTDKIGSDVTTMLSEH